MQENYPYTINNTLNKVLKYAAKIAHNGLLRDLWAGRLGREILSLLSDVDYDPSSVWKRVVFNRLNIRFRHLYDMALLIILMQGVPGEKEFNGILVDMNILFELYIYSLLKTSAKKWNIDYQRNLSFTSLHSESRISISQKPDFILKTQQDNQCLVLDVKYSQLDDIEQLRENK